MLIKPCEITKFSTNNIFNNKLSKKYVPKLVSDDFTDINLL